jgi:hypothetical protein
VGYATSLSQNYHINKTKKIIYYLILLRKFEYHVVEWSMLVTCNLQFVGSSQVKGDT